jgi:hypothetical protein
LNRIGWVVAALCLSLWGCGSPGAAFFNIDAVGPNGSLTIPTDVDVLSLTVHDPKDGAFVMSKDYPLASGSKFPVSLGLQGGQYDGSAIRVEVAALKSSAVRASAVFEVDLDPKEVTTVNISLIVNE